MRTFLLSLFLCLTLFQTYLSGENVTDSKITNIMDASHALKKPVFETEEIKKEEIKIEELEIVKEQKSEPVSFINAYTKSNEILLDWEDSTVDSYNIYRNTSMISNMDVLKNSKLLSSVKKEVQMYIDKDIPVSGEYYYAIINVISNKDDIVLISDSNSTTIPVTYTLPQPIKKEPLPLKPELDPEAKPEPKLKPEVKPIEKPKLKPALDPEAKIIKKKKVDYALWLNNSIKKYFLKGDYIRAKEEFNKIIRSKASEKIKKKAQLFLGRSYYEAKDYRKALKLFAVAKDYYPDEADFWIHKASRKIK